MSPRLEHVAKYVSARITCGGPLMGSAISQDAHGLFFVPYCVMKSPQFLRILLRGFAADAAPS